MFAYQLVFGAIMGLIAGTIANSKGRSFVGWFLFGLFFSLIAVIVVLVVGDLKEEKTHREKELAERRRLEEQLRQERLKNEVFRQYASQRMDVHDNQLGVSTRDPSMALAEGAHAPQLPAPTLAQPGEPLPAAPAPAAPAPETPAVDPRRWYYEIRGETMGPFTYEELRLARVQGIIASSTLLWEKGSSSYISADSLLRGDGW